MIEVKSPEETFALTSGNLHGEKSLDLALSEYQFFNNLFLNSN